VVGFEDLGMEAIYEFDVVDMPVTVAVDAGGTSAHITGPAEWQKRIATGEFKWRCAGRRFCQRPHARYYLLPA
jgi:fumarate hydratase class I